MWMWGVIVEGERGRKAKIPGSNAIILNCIITLMSGFVCFLMFILLCMYQGGRHVRSTFETMQFIRLRVPSVCSM